MTKKSIRLPLAAVLAVGGLLAVAAPAGAASGANKYERHDLVSDIPGKAKLTDAALVNPWGLAQGPTTPVWAADNGTNKASLITGDGVVGKVSVVPLTVSLPGDGPTGQVFNGTSGFVVSDGKGHSGPSLFLFDSESGDIIGWNPAVPPPQFSTQAQEGTHVDGAIFKGLALAMVGGAPYLYAADFHHGRVEVFDSKFHEAHLGGSFKDPNLPARYAPFGISLQRGKLYVSFAKQDAAAEDEVDGLGKGFVDVFDTRGHFEQRLVSRGLLDAPWGMAIAPTNWGAFGGALLVGNFGNGRINAYNPVTGKWLGTLKNKSGDPIQINGLWGLLFGNGTSAGTSTLVFSAGIRHEAHGLYGTITMAS